MLLIGLDAGTTSVSGVILDSENHQLLKAISREHKAELPGTLPEEDLQDPEMLADLLRDTADGLIDEVRPGTAGSKHIAGICITGQVHGILYVDSRGRSLSPLYTWQDRRGSLPASGGGPEGCSEDWVAWIRNKTGRAVPSGYGLLTHIINRREGKVPGKTDCISTILDFLSMRLTGASRPVIGSTNAHSWGLYDIVRREFREDALRMLQIDPGILPEIAADGLETGRYRGVPVYTAVGDNQAGFIGSVEDRKDTLLLNVGTSGQISVYAPEGVLSGRELDAGWVGALEIRPFPGGGYLLAGASLSGGSAYRLLERFFREVCRTFAGSDPGALLDRMTQSALQNRRRMPALEVETSFFGTRADPHAKGRISGITKDNFTSGAMIKGVLEGIAGELFRFYDSVPAEIKKKITGITGVGNGLRKNRLLREIISTKFGLPVHIPDSVEEAAVGAAVLAGKGAGLKL